MDFLEIDTDKDNRQGMETKLKIDWLNKPGCYFGSLKGKLGESAG